MLQLLRRYGWAFGVRGALAILYGLFLFVDRDLSLYALVMFSGFFVLSESLLLIIITFARDAGKMRAISIEGILGSVIAAIIIIGSSIGSMIMPGVTKVMLPAYIGSWMIVTGLFGLVHAAGMRSQVKEVWALLLSSLIALLCGFGLILQRDAGVFSLSWQIAAFTVLYGLLQFVMIAQVRSSTFQA